MIVMRIAILRLLIGQLGWKSASEMISLGVARFLPLCAVAL